MNDSQVSNQNEVPIKFPQDVRVEDIIFGEPRQNEKYGFKKIYTNQDVLIQVEHRVPFNMNVKESDSGYTQYSVALAFNVESEEPPQLGGTYDLLHRLDQAMPRICVANSKSWFGRRSLPLDKAKAFYIPQVKGKGLNDDGEWTGSQFAPIFNVKLPTDFNTGEFRFPILNEDGTPMDDPLVDVLVKGSYMTTILKLSYVYVGDKKVSISWEPVLMKVRRSKSVRDLPGIDLTEFELDSVELSDIQTGMESSRKMFINYVLDDVKRPLTFDLPFQLRAPFGVSTFENVSSDPSYSLQLSTENRDNNPDIDTFVQILRGLDDMVLQQGLENSKSWLGKTYKSRDVVEEFFKGCLRYSMKNGERNEQYAPTINLKLPNYNGRFQTVFYDNNGDILTDPLPELTGGSHLRAKIQLSKIWLSGGKFGVIWNALELHVQPGRKVRQFQFLNQNSDDDDDDDDDDGDAMPQQVNMVDSDEDENTEVVDEPVPAPVVEPEPAPKKKRARRRRKKAD